MATTSNIKIVWEDPNDLRNYIVVPLASSTTIAAGDLVKVTYATNTCSVVSAAENETTIGISKTYGTTTDAGDPITICVDCVIEGTIATGGDVVHAGQAVQYAAGGNGTNWTFSKTDTTDGIGYALEAAAAGSKCKIWLTSKGGVLTSTSNATQVGFFRAMLKT
jgi:hypothetical protein